MSNRYPVTVRFNLVEKQDLIELCKIMKCDEPRALKACFHQMVQAMIEMQKKLAAAGEQEDTQWESETTGDTSSSESGSSQQPD